MNTRWQVDLQRCHKVVYKAWNKLKHMGTNFCLAQCAVLPSSWDCFFIHLFVIGYMCVLYFSTEQIFTTLFRLKMTPLKWSISLYLCLGLSFCQVMHFSIITLFQSTCLDVLMINIVFFHHFRSCYYELYIY